MVDAALALPEETRLMIVAPVVRDRKGEFTELFADMQAQGYVRFRVGSGGEMGTAFDAADVPKLKKTEVEPRVRLGAADGRQNALLQMMNLKQGDSLSMQIEAVPNRRSLLWLAAGIVLSGLYLYQFRDLIADKKA